MGESTTASSLDLEAIGSLLRAERAHLELAEKIRVHREGLESLFNAHHRQSDFASDCDKEPVAESRKDGEGAKPTTMELLDPSDSVSCPSTAPIGHSTSRGTPSSVGRPAIKPSTISRRLLGEVFQGRVLDLEIPGLPRFERVEDSYLAATGLDVYREVSKDPETANVGAVRFVKDDFCYGGEPGSMMRLAGPEGYWLMVLPRREERASPPKLHSSKVVMAPDEGKSVVAKDVAPQSDPLDPYGNELQARDAKEHKMVSVHVSLAKAMAAITGNRMWPFYQDPNEYHMIRSRFLLGAIRDGVVYDAHDPSLPRFKCLKGKIEPFDGDDVWTKVSHPGQDEEVDYFLFSPGAVQEDESRERSRAAQGTRLCMMRIPAMNRYWVLFAGAGPRLNEAASPASPAGVLPHAPARAGQSQTSFMRKGLIFVVVAIVVALLCRATPEYEPPPVRRGPI